LLVITKSELHGASLRLNIASGFLTLLSFVEVVELVEIVKQINEIGNQAMESMPFSVSIVQRLKILPMDFYLIHYLV